MAKMSPCARLLVYKRRMMRWMEKWRALARKEVDKSYNHKRAHNKGRNGRLNKPWER